MAKTLYAHTAIKANGEFIEETNKPLTSAQLDKLGKEVVAGLQEAGVLCDHPKVGTADAVADRDAEIARLTALLEQSGIDPLSPGATIAMSPAEVIANVTSVDGNLNGIGEPIDPEKKEAERKGEAEGEGEEEEEEEESGDTLTSLRKRASQLEIPGRSAMDADELKKAIEEAEGNK